MIAAGVHAVSFCALPKDEVRVLGLEINCGAGLPMGLPIRLPGSCSRFLATGRGHCPANPAEHPHHRLAIESRPGVWLSGRKAVVLPRRPSLAQFFPEGGLRSLDPAWLCLASFVSEHVAGAGTWSPQK